MLLNKMHGIDAGYRKPEKRSCSFYEPFQNVTKSEKRPYTILVKEGDCDCCAWCENGKKNTLYLIERVSYDTALFSAISLALMLVIHCH